MAAISSSHRALPRRRREGNAVALRTIIGRTITVLLALSTTISAQNGSVAPLAQLQFDIVGVRLVVDPPVLTVPKQIATQINTRLEVPAGAGANTVQAIAALASGGVVEATLRGPSIPPTRITTRPGQPIPLPPFALPGDYFLDGIRLLKDGVPLLDATAPDGRPATTIPIAVISEVFVTSVTSRPLSLDEIKEKGIVIDQNNFQTVSFQVAFNIDGAPFTIDLPAALPTRELLNTQPDRSLIIQELGVINQQLASTLTTLPPEFDRPGLNFSIAALPFFPVIEDGEEPGFDIPPVTGIVFIPGNVAFLNQFFSVMLMVSNVAPGGTPLVLRDVTGTVKLPTGLDRIPAASYESPGDDPLRLARIDGVGQQPTIRVVQLGPDGELGTADDLPTISPQTGGQGEFLVEGLKEGGHIFDIEIAAVLDGLPSGPVPLVGQAAGAVFVRNPTFSVTLAHPRTVRSGEPYDIYATVTNTSRSPANLVSVNLDPLGISGAQLVSEPTVSFETLPAGQSVTARFQLIAQQTGEVTASSFTGEADGGIRLFTGVGERGVPLSPNAIVLPASTSALPDSLVAAAQRVLGQAFSIATAPAEALPADVLFVKRQTVIDRALELAEAGQRLQFGDTMPAVVRDLLLDWTGVRLFDPGFDQLMRTTDAGRALLHEIGLVLGPEFAADPFTAQGALVEQALARSAPLTAAARGGAGAGLALRVTRSDGLATAAAASTIPGGALIAMTQPAADTALGVIVNPSAARYTIEAASASGGIVDLGVTAPAASDGQAQFVRFAGVPLEAGGVVRVIVDLSAPVPLTALVDRTGDGIVDETLTGIVDVLTEQALAVVDVRQLESSAFASPGDSRDPATYGLLVGVLFNKPTTEVSVESKVNYAIDANRVTGAAQQVGGRLVYLYLERPIGPFEPRSLTVRAVQDLRGGSAAETTRPIRMVLSDGGRVIGQVREANGSGVPGSFLSLVISYGSQFSFTVSTIHADESGGFDFEYVPRSGVVVLTAQHPQTRAIASLNARIRGVGESLLLNPTFLGAGAVQGRVLAADGVTPVPNATVALFPGSVLSARGFQTRANALGEFVVTDVPVGVFTLRAIDGLQASGQTTGVLERAGETVSADIVIVNQPDDGGRLIGRVFLSDGLTPAAGFRVFVGTYTRSAGTIAAIDATTTDASGSFSFARILPADSYDVVAVDTATGQVGSTRVGIVALTTSAVNIVMEATGGVEGVVFNASGQPVPGALVAGGVALVQTDANGRFLIEGVPAGKRTIQAGDPVTRRRGAAEVNVLPGQTVTAAVTLEARATITGRVLDADGQPVPRASVRIPQVGGYTFVIANNQGVYTFPDMPLGDHLIQSPGPSAESLIAFLEANGYDPNVAFTSGDGPSAPPPPPSSSEASAVIAAYQNAVQTFLSVDESLLGLPDADLGGFGWNKVRLFQDAVTQVADVKFLSRGTVAGRTVDSAGRPTGALVRVSALKVGSSGAPLFGELERKNSDAATGEFSFGGIPRFDLATFQAAGVRGGDFTLEAAQQFSPAIVQFRDQLNTANPDRADIVLQFPAAAETNGTARGFVLMPDGVTPAPAGTVVQISFGDLTVTTNADGRFVSLLPIPAGPYTFTAQTPTGGLRGRVTAQVPAGGEVDVQIRLLGLGTVLVQARRANSQPVPNATVTLRRGTFPADQADGVTDAGGERRFVNLSEGPFSVEIEEAITGLRGRASGVVLRGGEVTAVVTLTASGRVTGTFLTADGAQTIPFAQVTLNGSGVQAYATTDAQGRFELTAIPVGAFTVEANDPATGRLGRASGQLSFEGQSVDVTVLQLPRGTVAGYVLNADGVTGLAGANVELTASSFVATRLQVTTQADGSFRIAGVSAGAFTVRAKDSVSGAEGTAHGVLSFEGEIIDRNVILEPFASIRVSVLDEKGQPAPNVRLTAAGRTAAVDANGQFTFENLKLGTYDITGVSLADQFNGGRAAATLDDANELLDVTVTLRGVAPVTVRVVASDGLTPVSSARVTLNAKGAFGNQPPGPTAASLVGFTGGSGAVTFPSVPLGDYFARGEGAALGGVATGSTPGVNQPSGVTVVLGASGRIEGKVFLPDGVTPAFRALVTLNFQSQSGLQSGTLQVVTDINGNFAFGGIPLGAFTLGAFEVVSAGVRTVTGTLTADGQLLDLGVLVLDNTGPRIVTVSPVDGASGVAPVSPIVLTFNEAIQTQSVTAAVLSLRQGTTLVPGTIGISADRTVVTFTPSQALQSSAIYTLTVKGAPDGPRDDSNQGMVDPFVSAFSVRDLIPPTIVSLSPANGAREIAPEATVRVTFSEALANATLLLRNSAGQIVPTVNVFTFGGTVAVASPVDFLPPNASYTATVSNVTDTAGNALPGGPISFTFRTIDTIAPLITALSVQGSARPGASITVVPGIDADDVARVEYVAGDVSVVSTSAPFPATLAIPAGTPTFAVSARAVDQSGNRSAAFLLNVPVEENQPPTVGLVNLAGATVVGQGTTLQFDVSASDDAGIAQILFSSVGAASANVADAITGSPASVTRRYTVQVPSAAPPGATFTVQTAAIDTSGATSAPVSLTLTVRDGLAPMVTIVEPAAGVAAVPGSTLSVVVAASDAGGVTRVTLTCNPLLVGCEARSISPTTGSTTQTFSVQVPSTVVAPASITLSASASDAAGNVGQAGQTLAVADIVAPTLNGLQPASGSTRVLAGSSVTLRADATDNVAVTAVDFSVDGGLPTTGSALITPPVTPANVTFTVSIPSNAASGDAITVRARARDAAGQQSSELILALIVGDTAAPSITLVQPAAGAAFSPGQTIAVTASATDDVGIAQIVVRARGVVTFDETRTFSPPVTPAQAAFSIPTGVSTPAGSVTVTVQATDAAGNLSAEAAREVSIGDATAPTVAVTAPAAGASIDPRDALLVTVEASDAVGVAEVGLTTSGALVTTIARVVSPVQAQRTEQFSVSFPTPPIAGGQMTLFGSARDAAGNQGHSPAVVLNIQDVVAPSVAAVVPAPGATNVPANTTIVVTFAESMERQSLTGAVSLTVGGSPIAAAVLIDDDDRRVTLTPAAPLAINTLHTVTVVATVRDRAGNAMGALFTSSFRTVSPDEIPPKVVTIQPPNNAVGVGTTTPVVVTFTEAISQASVTASSFRVTADNTAVAGTFSFGSGDAVVTFTPSAELPFNAVVVIQLTGDLRDAAGNRLVNVDGSEIVTPITSTYVTGEFAIVSPGGTSVLEAREITLEARGAASLEVASVVFSVNGRTLTTDTTAPFQALVVTPGAAFNASMTVLASARNGANVEIARAERVYAIVRALHATPAVIGLDRGASGTLRFSLGEPAPEDVTIALSAVAPQVVTLASPSVVLAAGAMFAEVGVTACTSCPLDPPAGPGRLVGNTTVVASSTRGSAGAIVSVSDRRTGETTDVVASPAGVGVLLPPSAGQIALRATQQSVTVIALFNEAASADTAVTVTSSNPAIASAVASIIAAGQTVTTLTVTAGEDGVAVLTLRAGDVVRSVTVFVGTPPADRTPIAMASPIGLSLALPPSAGQFILNAAQLAMVGIVLLDVANDTGSPLAVAVSSSDPTIASAVATAIQPGQTTTTLSVTTGTNGTATLLLSAGGVTRSLNVIVGTPSPGQTPVVFAAPVGITLPALPLQGRIVAPPASGVSFALVLLPAPASSDTVVTVTSSDPTIASVVTSSVLIPAGSTVASLQLTTGAGGTATLTLEVGGTRRELQLFVGAPSPERTPVSPAPPVGLSIMPDGAQNSGRVLAPSGSAGVATIGVQLVSAAATQSTPVTVTTSNPAVVSLGAANSLVTTLDSGGVSVQLTFSTAGVDGAALLTFEFGNVRRELLVIVGNPPASQLPAVVAPIVGVEVTESVTQSTVQPAGARKPAT